MVYRGSLESHVRAGRLSEKDARNIAKLLQIDFDLNKKIPWWKKNISQKLRGQKPSFFVYNYYLTKPHKCAIINLDPPLGGRRSRNSHYTTSFKKSQIKSSRRIAQSFFPKSLFFCATCTTLTALKAASPDATPICNPFCLAARARAHMPAAPVESRPSKNFFTYWVTGAPR